MHNHTHCTNVKVTRDEKAWEVEVSADIPVEEMANFYTAALEEVRKNAKLDGFRPGHAPADRVLAIYGEATIWRQAAEMAIDQVLPELLAEQKLPIVDAPKVTVGTPEKDKPLSFTARAPLAPEITLANYKKIAAKHNAKKEEVVVTDEEHADAMKHIRRERSRIDKVEAGIDPKEAAEQSRAAEEKDLPALDDDFVRSLGYESADQFAQTLRDNMKSEKENQALEKRRMEMLDEFVEKSKINYPSLLRNYELDDMEARLSEDLSRMGVTLPAYLAETKKTHEELRDSWKEAADKRAKTRLILAEISRKENIEADEARVEEEVKYAQEHFPKVNVEAIRSHVLHALRNEATMAFLEGITE